MGLPANATTGVKYNFEEDGSPQIKSLPPQILATFKRAIPSFSVTHIPTALPWYKEVLGFAVVGAADAGRAELHRAEPGARKGEGGVSLYLRKAAADEPVPKGSLWIEVDSVDNLYAELSYKMEKYAQDLSNYFPPHHFGSSKILAKPRNTSWGQREMTCVDAGGNSIVFFQVL
ncbi:hypothetical protein BCV69DRAFT_281409 [Microstroma glucosiphilum]|uniref:Glyoxalase/fosfomycin resistance/dioxygenase domain-containing protein n=1 Tax=Pseudomicrostroma glucosiphilum TaxID=1684307 RepID=A0A316UB18_9BASI|nr:hypothetical protein BCV69DRAFT_281409 [Pseudomicrostroma glucosiphilum]PWN22416.1 hypothetical protein BCV69DRAFT_281409 [Pseudomicrostroma glucosiphilum]